MLREVDREFLTEQGYRFAEYPAGGMTLLVIEGYELPAGYDPPAVDLLLQIPSSYPDGKIDMWWVHPHVVFAASRRRPVNADVTQSFAQFAPEPGRVWQRFSRHPQWRPGVDDLRSFLRALRSTLENEARQVAA